MVSFEFLIQLYSCVQWHFYQTFLHFLWNISRLKCRQELKNLFYKRKRIQGEYHYYAMRTQFCWQLLHPHMMMFSYLLSLSGTDRLRWMWREGVWGASQWRSTLSWTCKTCLLTPSIKNRQHNWHMVKNGKILFKLFTLFIFTMMNPSTSSTKSYLVKGTSAEKRMIGILARRRRQSSPIILLIEVGQVWDNCYLPHPSSSIQLYVIFSCPGLGSRKQTEVWP